MSGWATPPTVIADSVATSTSFNELSANQDFLGNPPQARLYVSEGFGVESSTWTSIPFDRTEYELNGMHNDDGAFVIPYAGLYVIQGQVQYASLTAEAFCVIGIYSSVNGTQVGIGNGVNALTGQGPALSFSDDVRLTEGDNISLQTWQNSGATQNFKRHKHRCE